MLSFKPRRPRCPFCAGGQILLAPALSRTTAVVSTRGLRLLCHWFRAATLLRTRRCAPFICTDAFSSTHR
eukprot:3878308-Pleurochrysis_carterae.AAC.2